MFDTKFAREYWVPALRSGKYKQGKSCLKSSVGYCCLGVLCDVHPDVEFETEDGMNYAIYDGVVGDLTLPDNLNSELGFVGDSLLPLPNDEVMDTLVEHFGEFIRDDNVFADEDEEG